MKALDAIVTRRSIRKYLPQPIEEDKIKILLDAAMNAPSAGNEQPWQFVILTDRELLDKITVVHPYAQMLKHAPLAILICGDLQLEQHKGYWVQDCSAATENLLIAANAIGLGAVWLGVYPRPERVSGLQSLIGLPEFVIPLALVAIGYPNETKQTSSRFNRDRIHRNKW